MLATSLLKDSDELVAALNTARPFLDGLQKLADFYDSLFRFIAGTAEGGAKINEFASHLHNAVVGSRQVLDDMPVHEFFRSVDTASHAFVAFVEGDSQARLGAQGIAARIGAFSGLFDRFVRQQRPEHALPVLREAHSLKLEIDSFLKGLFAATAGLVAEAPHDGEEVLTLTLLGDYTLSDLLNKLTALRDICTSIELVLEDTDPLPTFRLLRIESGSISLTLAAGALAISMLRRFLVAAIQFSYRNYTREGKLRHGIPDEVKALEELIKLRAKLEKAGLDTDALDKRLESNGNAIARNLAALLLRENHIRVDDEEFMNPDDDGLRQLPYTQPRILPRSAPKD